MQQIELLIFTTWSSSSIFHLYVKKKLRKQRINIGS